MASKNLDNMTIEELEALIHSKRQSNLDGLKEKRSALMKELRAVESEIEAAGGRAMNGAGGRGGRRGPRSGPSMGSSILEAMSKAKGDDVSIGDLVDQLKGRTSSSKPGIIVSQAMVRLKKDGLVQSTGRGVYKLTAAGRKGAAAGE